MTQTPLSLLERLRHQADADGWKLFVDLYTPLIHGWLRRYGLSGADADDISQEVLSVVVRELPRFQHDGVAGAFRGWLRAVTVNRLRELWRSRRYQPKTVDEQEFLRLLDQLEDPSNEMAQRWNQEHDLHLAGRLLRLVEPDFEPKTWQAFHRVALDGASASAAAAELGMSANAVLLAKSRVLRRMRREAAGLLD